MNANLIYANELLDCYEELFNKNQKDILNDYFRNDYSMQEIAENHNISKQAVSIQINRCLKQLEKYEDIFKIVQKDKEIDTLIDEMLKSNNENIIAYASKLKLIKEK